MTTVSADCGLKAEECGVAGVTAVPAGMWGAHMGSCVSSVESCTLKMLYQPGQLGAVCMGAC